LFIPNSFYIITDLYHLGDKYNDRQTPQWFDLAMILSYVWNGLLLGVLSVRQMERALLPRQTLRNELLFLYPVMWTSALGIYIGRYLRYNSWDVSDRSFPAIEGHCRHGCPSPAAPEYLGHGVLFFHPDDPYLSHDEKDQ